MGLPDDPGTNEGSGSNDQDVQRRLQTLFQRDSAARALGMVLESARKGEVVLSMEIREDMTNFHGSCHGGILFSLADASLGLACNSHEQAAVAASADISYLSPAFVGDRLVSECHEQFREGRNAIYDARVTNQDGKTIALFRGKTRIVTG